MTSSLFQIGSLSLRWYSLWLMVAVFIPFYLIRRGAISHKKIDTNLIDDLALLLIPLGVVGARAYHVLDKWEYYQFHLFETLFIWQGGLGIFGALFFGLLGLYFFSKHKKINIFLILDHIVPYLLLGQALGRVGNFFNQEGFGPPTNLPWKVFIDPSHRPSEFQNQNYFHPTFFYEGLWDFIGFIMLFLLAKRKLNTGIVTGAYCFYYGLGRLLIEFVRIDTFMVGNFKLGYFISFSFLLVGLLLLFKFFRMRITYDS